MFKNKKKKHELDFKISWVFFLTQKNACKTTTTSAATEFFKEIQLQYSVK